MIKITSFTVTEKNLLTFFIEHPTESFGIRELSRKTSIDYKMVHTTIQKLTKKRVIIKIRKANVDFCTLNLKGDITYVYFVELIRRHTFFLKHKDIHDFFMEIEQKIKELHHTLVIFGSFAKEKEHTLSDVDILIIAPTKETAEEIQRVITSESFILKKQIHSIALDEKEFLINFQSKGLNVVKESFKNHIILTGIEAYYKGVQQTI